MVSFKSKKKSSEEFRKLYFGKQSKVVHFKSWTENRELNLVTSKNREYNNKKLGKTRIYKRISLLSIIRSIKGVSDCEENTLLLGLLCVGNLSLKKNVRQRHFGNT